MKIQFKSMLPWKHIKLGAVFAVLSFATASQSAALTMLIDSFTETITIVGALGGTSGIYPGDEPEYIVDFISVGDFGVDDYATIALGSRFLDDVESIDIILNDEIGDGISLMFSYAGFDDLSKDFLSTLTGVRNSRFNDRTPLAFVQASVPSSVDSGTLFCCCFLTMLFIRKRFLR